MKYKYMMEKDQKNYCKTIILWYYICYRNYRFTIILGDGRMRRKMYLVVLATEAIACVLFELLHVRFSGAFSAIEAFPYEQI